MPKRPGDTTQIQQLLDLVKEGREGARDQLIEHAAERLRVLTRSMFRGFPKLRRWEQTDDVFTQALAKLHRSLAEVIPESPRRFYGLAAAQIRRVLIDLARHYFGPDGLGANHESGDVGASAALHASRQCENRSLEPSDLLQWTEFHEHVEKLPDDEREVFGLLWYGGLTQEEAAEMLGVTDRTVRNRWRSAKRSLYQRMSGEGPPVS